MNRNEESTPPENFSHGATLVVDQMDTRQNGLHVGVRDDSGTKESGAVFVRNEETLPIGEYASAASLEDFLHQRGLDKEEIAQVLSEAAKAGAIEVSPMEEIESQDARQLRVRSTETTIGGGGVFLGKEQGKEVMVNGVYININEVLQTMDALLAAIPSEAEPEKKQSRFKRILAAAAGLGIVLGSFVPSYDASTVDNVPHKQPTAAGPAVPGVDVAPIDTAPADPPTNTPEQVNPIFEKNWTIEPGMGGEALFSQIGADPAQWYGMQEQLIEQFPKTFYRMEDGNVGIAKPGELPTNVQLSIAERLDTIQ